MKTLALLCLSLAVALAMPSFPLGVVQSPVLMTENQSPLLGDLVPLQGHVEVENPAPQDRLDSKEQQEKLPPVPVDMEQSQSQKLEVKVKPPAKVEQEGEVKTEVKMEPELEAEPEVKVEQELKAEPEVKVEQELEAEPEVKVEQELKAEPEVKVEQEGEVKTEVKMEPELKAEPEVKVEQEGKENPEVKVEQEPEAGPQVEPEPQVNMDPEPEVNFNPDVMADLEVNMEPDIEMGPEVKADPHFAAESEMEPKPEPEENPMFNEVQEKFQIQMKLEGETETGQEDEERHIDMEGKYEMVGEPIMELEPMDDIGMFGGEGIAAELPEVEKYSRVAFQSRYPVDEPLPEQERFLRKEDNVLYEEPIVGLEPEMRQEPFQSQDFQIPDAAIMDEGQALEMMGQQVSHLEYNFPNEEARMGMERERQQDFLPKAGSNYSLMEEPRSEFVRETEKGQRSCPCVVYKGKCYWFFRKPMSATDAEFFCQDYAPGGHLASITGSYIHREMMNMMLCENGASTRAWVGGLRYLQTGRFIWLDGSRWGYADWLSGEPNNTANKEDCVEVLANGKFNDFTCWEPQAFFCSVPLL